MSAAVIVNQIKALHSDASHAFNRAVSGGRFHGINQTMVLQLLMLMAVPLLIQVWHGLVDLFEIIEDPSSTASMIRLELDNLTSCTRSWVFRRVHYYTDSLTT